jgi:hypothetical protein
MPRARESLVLLRVLVVFDKKLPFNSFLGLCPSSQPLDQDNFEILAVGPCAVTTCQGFRQSLLVAPRGFFRIHGYLVGSSAASTGHNSGS